MALAHSPRVVTNGLVFCVDQGNTHKSWKGAPTTNLIVTTPLSFGVYAYASGPVSSSTVDTNNQPISVRRYTVTSATNTARARILPSLTVGQTYTFSCKIKYNGTNTTTPTFEVSASKGNPEAGGANTLTGGLTTVSLGNNWYYLKYTFTVAASPTGSAILTYGVVTGTDSTYVNNTFDVYDEQFEVLNFATPFVNGARSNTQALLDLTGQNTITATSLTYTSDGSFSFDGSDRLNFTLTGSASSTGYTRIVWIKPTQSNADMKSVMLNTIGNNSDMAVGIQNNKAAFHQYSKTGTSGTTDGDYTASGSTTLSLNTIYMIAITVDRNISTNNINVYLNGKLDGTASLTLGAAVSDAVIIGGPSSDPYSGARMFYGNCYAAMHYNRVLSADEIQQNFNAIRGRYGI